MKYHGNARLTIHQRRALRADYLAGMSRAELAAKYHVSPSTVQKWADRDTPEDRSSAPHRRRSKRPPGYKAAVRPLRQAHRAWGTRRLAHELRAWYPRASRSTVRHILRVAGLQAPPPAAVASPSRFRSAGIACRWIVSTSPPSGAARGTSIRSA